MGHFSLTNQPNSQTPNKAGPISNTGSQASVNFNRLGDFAVESRRSSKRKSQKVYASNVTTDGKSAVIVGKES